VCCSACCSVCCVASLSTCLCQSLCRSLCQRGKSTCRCQRNYLPMSKRLLGVYLPLVVCVAVRVAVCVVSPLCLPAYVKVYLPLSKRKVYLPMCKRLLRVYLLMSNRLCRVKKKQQSPMIKSYIVSRRLYRSQRPHSLYVCHRGRLESHDKVAI